MKLLRRFFAKVTFSCNFCPSVQTISLRRIHLFERFYELTAGQPVLIQCPTCHHGLQCPSPYRSHAGHFVTVDPHKPPINAFIHDLY